MKKILSLTLMLILLVACAPTASLPPTPIATATTAPPPTSTPAPRIWWRDAVFYEIFVRSFNDTNGDGIGDFNGITQKLDYLQKLGVNAIWLMPIHPSPSYHGYDVLNYYAVNPQYGTLADFKNLLAETHRRGMHIIIDLVLNHTSSQHPWFVDANSNPGSPYRDWYIWSTSPQGKYWHPGKDASYFGLFSDGMPDLNYLNPAVTAQMEKMAAYWLNDVGVDGFRLDAAKHLVEDGAKTENTPATHAWLRGFYDFVKKNKPDAYIVGEVYGAGGLLASTYTGQVDEVFNFELASGFVNSAAGSANSGVNSGIRLTQPKMPDGQYATFLTNHDQDRSMSVLQGVTGRAAVAASLLLTGPGTPFIYYGEEIGMTGRKPDEDIRRPMQWSADPLTAGFTTGQPWRAPALDAPKVNVAGEDSDPASLLNQYRALISLRAAHPALRTGAMSLLLADNPAVFASLRSEDGETLLVLVNLSGETLSGFKLDWTASGLKDGAYNFEPVLGQTTQFQTTIHSSQSSPDGLPALSPYQTLVFRLR